MSTQPVTTTTTISTASVAAAPLAFNLRLVNDDQNECHFWVALSKHGSLTPNELLDQKSVSQILIAAAKEGLSEEGPIILSDSRISPPRYVYLLPKPELKKTGTKSMWLQDLSAAVTSWSPPALGFYFAEELMTVPEVDTLLEKIMLDILKNISTRNIYFLIGTYNINTILNFALRLKDRFWKSGIEIFVFHQ